MEGTYVDLFATKSVEYILVLGFLAAFVGYWRVLNRPVRPLPARRPAAARTRGAWFELRDDLFYHQGHAWAVPEGDAGVLRVGIDDFAQKLLGRPTAVRLPSVGSRVEQGAAGCSLTVNAKAFDLLCPVGGEVLAVNERVLQSPGLLNDDPYGEGWLMKVKSPSARANLRNLLTGALARAWMDQTAASLRRRMSGDVGTALQDGGILVSGFAAHLSDGTDKWDDVAREFLLGD